MSNNRGHLFVFVVIFSLGISAFSMFIIFTQFNFIFYGLAFFIVFFVFWMFMTIISQMKNGNWDNKFSQKKICPHCDSSIYVDAVFCPKCGKKVEKTVTCGYCGHENPPGLIQCEECKGLL